MYELIYTSAAKRLLTPPELAEILKRARANNASLGISGILLYHEGSFFQILEGDESKVKALFDTIRDDQRHWRILVLREGPIQTRRFGEWSMGFVSLDAQLLRSLPGRHALLSNGTLEVDADSMSELLDRFRDGEWRRYVLA